MLAGDMRISSASDRQTTNPRQRIALLAGVVSDVTGTTAVRA